MNPTPPSSRPVFHVLSEGGYRFHWADRAVSLELRHLHRRWSELHGELEVRCGWDGAAATDGIVFAGSFNIASLQARANTAKHLYARTRVSHTQFDWLGFLEDFSRLCVHAEREGAPAVDLMDLPDDTPATVWTAGGIPLLSTLPVIWFGDGGSAKSYLALYVAGELAKDGHRVLYADWEFAGSEHKERWRRLFGDVAPAIKYVRCDRSMTVENDHLARLVSQHHIDYLIADSVAFAMADDGAPEDAKVAVAYFAALRRLHIGSLNLAHQTKSSDAAEHKPFGSTFWHNGARMTWFLKGSQDADVPKDQLRVALYNRKNNVGRLLPTLGFALEFGETHTHVVPVDPGDTVELAKGLPLYQRLRDELKLGPQTIATLADALQAKPNSITQTARRYDRLFTKVLGSDGLARISLVSSR